LKQRLKIVFFLLLCICLVPAACGKKGPPFLPTGENLLRVEGLQADWENRVFHLNGTIVDAQGQAKDTSTITGCRVFHARYALDNPPCEGCPIDYKTFKEIKGQVINEGGFSCRVPGRQKKGIHFFKVRLIGRKGEIGPFSDRAKLMVDD